MDNATIKNLLTNSGLNVFDIRGDFVYFEDPSCIFPAFDTILEYAWVVVCILTGIMLFGWAMLYIKNGVKIDSLFHNAKSLILILAVLSIVKPIVNAVYGDNLFAKQCEIKRVSLAMVNELLEQRNKQFGISDEYFLYETFTVTDSGPTTNSISYSSQPEENYNQTNIAGTSNFVYVEIEPNAIIYVSKDGAKIKRSGGSVAWRNNNPGNIIKSSFARAHGAIGETERWAVFPDEETGLKAMVSLLRTNKYNKLTIYEAVNKWCPGTSDKYPNFVAKTSGLPVNSVLQNLNDDDLYKIVRAMQTFEGWIPGKEERI